MAKSIRSNISILIVAVFFIIALFKLFHLQIIDGNRYELLSRNNFLREAIIPSPRGTIYDRNGIRISYSRPMVNLFAKNISEDNYLDLLKDLYDNEIFLSVKEKKSLESQLKSNFQTKRILLKKDLSIEEIFIIDTKLSSNEKLEMINDYLRVYPYKEVGSHLVGHLTSNDKKDSMYGFLFSNRKGANGIEKDLDDHLTGIVGAEYFIVDSKGNEINFKNTNYTFSEIEKGKDIHTTIDIELQKIIYESMKELNGAVLVTNIDNGEVLSIVSKPGFDPNLFSKPLSNNDWKRLKTSSNKPFLNRAFLVSNPPGSIIKIITAAAGLEEGKITTDSTVYCPGYMKIGNRNFRCWLKGGHGNVDVSKALVTSCDVFFYNLGMRLGIDKYSQWLSKFGIGELHAYLPYKQKLGTIPDETFINKYLKGKFYNGDMANVAIGQGYLTLNVIQAHKMISIIASDGYFTKFRLYKDEKIETTKIINFKDKNIKEIKIGLLGVVNDNNGTGFHARMDGKVAGKTGTAQVISKDSSKYGYGKFKNHGWFTAYYPFEKPKIAITVFAEHGDSGGRAGGPIIKEIISFYKNKYMDIPHDKP